ncbi:MAG: hypothetical protein RJP95_00780 [Pirellulales bacterium]
MYQRRLEEIVAALCQTLIAERAAEEDQQELLDQQVAEFVTGQVAHMPGFLRLPMVVLTFAFDYWGVLRRGRRFSRQSFENRHRQIASWRGSRVGPCRDFVEFYESLTVFGWYSEIDD